MKITKYLLYVMAILFLLCDSASAQTLAPSDVLETGWHVSVNGGYSNLQNQATSNGFLTSVEVRIAKHWSARLDYFSIASPKAAVILLKPQYGFSLAHILPKSSFMDVAKLEGFVNLGIGAGRASDYSNPFKPAFSFGLGLNYRATSMLTIRPCEFNIIHGGVLRQPGKPDYLAVGNYSQLATGLGLRF